MSNLLQPWRGEIWLVGLDQTVGSEMAKTRPAVVVSSDSVGILDVNTTYRRRSLRSETRALCVATLE